MHKNISSIEATISKASYKWHGKWHGDVAWGRFVCHIWERVNSLRNHNCRFLENRKNYVGIW